MLIGARDKIAYDGEMDEDELRNEIAALGPKYGPLRTNPSEAPRDVKLIAGLSADTFDFAKAGKRYVLAWQSSTSANPVDVEIRLSQWLRF
jgi:hypothetical protein